MTESWSIFQHGDYKLPLLVKAWAAKTDGSDAAGWQGCKGVSKFSILQKIVKTVLTVIDYVMLYIIYSIYPHNYHSGYIKAMCYIDASQQFI